MENKNYKIVFDSDAMSSASEHIQHYGVKGMKWGEVKRQDPVSTQATTNKLYRPVFSLPQPGALDLQNILRVGPNPKPNPKWTSQQTKIAISDADTAMEILKSGGVTNFNELDSKKRIEVLNAIRDMVIRKTKGMSRDNEIRYKAFFISQMNKLLGYDISDMYGPIFSLPGALDSLINRFSQEDKAYENNKTSSSRQNYVGQRMSQFQKKKLSGL